MNPETTNKLMTDTSAEIPRIIKRGSLDVTSVDVSGSFAIGTNSVTIPEILFSNHNIVEVYNIDEAGNFASRLNNYNPASGVIPYSRWYYLDSTTSGGQTVLRINITTANTPSQTTSFLYVVYSSTYI